MFQKVQGLFESGGNQKISLGREMADKRVCKYPAAIVNS
jgi:hypothetical protein